MNNIIELPNFLKNIKLENNKILINLQCYNKISKDLFVLDVLITDKMSPFLSSDKKYPLVGISYELLDIGDNIIFGALIKKEKENIVTFSVGVKNVDIPLLEEVEEINDRLICTYTPSYLYINPEVSVKLKIKPQQKVLLKVYNNFILKEQKF